MKQNGRRRRQYVPASKLEETIAACQGYRERRKRQQEKRAELERILGNLSFLTRACRRANRIDQLLPHEQDHVRRIQAQGIAAPGRPSVWRRRGFMGHLRKLWVQRAYERRLSQGSGVGQPTAQASPPPPAEEAMSEANWVGVEEPPKKQSRRYWRLPHELPEWFTDDLWQEMASRIPKG